MSNLIPEKRMDRTGKLVTRHVKPEQESAARKPLPAPSLATVETPDGTTKRDEIIANTLRAHLSEEDSVSYLAFISRKSDLVKDALAKALDCEYNKERTAVALSVFDTWSNNIALFKLAIDDPEFILAMSRIPEGEPQRESWDDPYGAVISDMENAFRDNFKKNNINPSSFDVDTYRPFLQAATITKSLGLDNSTSTSMDEHLQRQHVMDNLDTFVKHYPILHRAIGSVDWLNQDPIDSQGVLAFCNVLDSTPHAAELLLAYAEDRKRLDLDEFTAVVDGPSLSLSSGTL